MTKQAKIGGARVATQHKTVYLPPLEFQGEHRDPHGASIKKGDPVILRPHDPRLREVFGKVVRITTRTNGRGLAFDIQEYDRGLHTGDEAHTFYDWDGFEHEQKAKKREEGLSNGD